jgi:hypothetical protein
MLHNLKRIIVFAVLVIAAIAVCILFSNFIMNAILPVLALGVFVFLIVMLFRRNGGQQGQ